MWCSGCQMKVIYSCYLFDSIATQAERTGTLKPRPLIAFWPIKRIDHLHYRHLLSPPTMRRHQICCSMLNCGLLASQGLTGKLASRKKHVRLKTGTFHTNALVSRWPWWETRNQSAWPVPFWSPICTSPPSLVGFSLTQQAALASR